jgi:hypothetical protein
MSIYHDWLSPFRVEISAVKAKNKVKDFNILLRAIKFSKITKSIIFDFNRYFPIGLFNIISFYN